MYISCRLPLSLRCNSLQGLPILHYPLFLLGLGCQSLFRCLTDHNCSLPMYISCRLPLSLRREHHHQGLPILHYPLFFLGFGCMSLFRCLTDHHHYNPMYISCRLPLSLRCDSLQGLPILHYPLFLLGLDCLLFPSLSHHKCNNPTYINYRLAL